MFNFVEIHPGQGGYDGEETPYHEDEEEMQINWSDVVIDEEELED